MSYLLKEQFYRRAFFEALIPTLQRHLPDLNKTRFLNEIFTDQWPDLELKERTRHVCLVFHQYLPQEFQVASKKLIKLAHELIADNSLQPEFGHIFLADYIAVFGLDHYPESMKAIEEVTQLMTCEFAVRPFLLKYPRKMPQQMYHWARHESPAVRRLASEGMRPRLPWGTGIPFLKKDPSPIFQILESLKNDPSEDVRRSVANNLNDISKDHPDVALDILTRWHQHQSAPQKLIKHAARTLLKKGDPRALVLFGFHGDEHVQIRNLNLTRKSLKIGEALGFQFDIWVGPGQEPKVRLEYAIHYVKANGRHSPKVFQVQEKVLPGGSSYEILRRQSFKDLTTRKHYPGEHILAILVNGIEKAREHFMLSKE